MSKAASMTFRPSLIFNKHMTNCPQEVMGNQQVEKNYHIQLFFQNEVEAPRKLRSAWCRSPLLCF